MGAALQWDQTRTKPETRSKTMFTKTRRQRLIDDVTRAIRISGRTHLLTGSKEIRMAGCEILDAKGWLGKTYDEICDTPAKATRFWNAVERGVREIF